MTSSSSLSSLLQDVTNRVVKRVLLIYSDYIIFSYDCVVAFQAASDEGAEIFDFSLLKIVDDGRSSLRSADKLLSYTGCGLIGANDLNLSDSFLRSLD